MDFAAPQWVNDLWMNGKLLQSAWLGGFIGNLAASGAYDLIKAAGKSLVTNRREIWRDAEDLKNGDLLRTLRLAECDAVIAICETCLIEDYDTDPSLLRTLISPSKWRSLAGRLSDPAIDAVLLLRSELLDGYHAVSDASPADLEKQLTVAVRDVETLVARNDEVGPFSSITELKEQSTADFEVALRKLLDEQFRVPLPEQLFGRIRLHWFDYLRVSFRRHLRKNPAAQHAFETDVLSTIPELAKSVRCSYAEVSETLNSQDKKLSDIFDFLRLALGKREEQIADIQPVGEDVARLIELANKEFKHLISSEAAANQRHAEVIAELVAISATTGRATDTAERQLEFIVGSRPSALDIASYRNAIRTRFRHLRLETLSADQVYYQDIELQAVFIPQHVRNCQQWLPHALEAPKELDRANDMKDTLAIVEVRDLADFRRQKPRGVLDVVRDQHKRLIVLLGDPGAGKSSLAIMMLLSWAASETEEVAFPVLIELRHYHRSGGGMDFLTYLQETPDLFHRFPSAVLKARLQKSGATLILDGLDEVFETDARASVLEQIARYASEFPDLRILVTSRLVGYPPRVLRDAGFEHWLLQDFTPNKIAEFLEHWCTVAVRSDTDRERVKQRVSGAIEVPAIREMAGNPLLLTMMAMLARQRDLPRDQAGLYGKCAELLLELWDTQKALAEHPDLRDAYLDLQDKQSILRRLAWRMQTGQLGLRGNLVSRAVLEDVMDEALARIEEVARRRRLVRLLIEQLRVRNFILCHLGGEHYAYVHRGFLEYFCAEDIRYRFESERSLTEQELSKIFEDHCQDDAWKEVLVLAANSLDPKVADRLLAPLIDRAKPSQMGPIYLAYSALTRARDPQALVTTRQSAWTFFADGITATPAKFRNRCFRALVTHWSDRATRDLLEKLATEYPTRKLRNRAIEAIASKWHDERTASLLQQFATSADAKTALPALRALTRFWNDEVEMVNTMLISIAEGGKDSKTRAFALERLSGERRDEIRAVLEKLAREDIEGSTRAVQTLVKFWPDERSRQTAIEVAESRPFALSSRQALQVLAQRWRDTSTQELLKRYALDHEGSLRATEAIALLGANWREESVRDLLLEVLLSLEATSSRVQALAMLASFWRASLTESQPVKTLLQSKEGRSLAREAGRARYTLGPAKAYLRGIADGDGSSDRQTELPLSVKSTVNERE